MAEDTSSVCAPPNQPDFPDIIARVAAWHRRKFPHGVVQADHAAEEAADVVIAAVCVLLVLSRDPLAEVARKLSAVEGRP
jgi:hypothetical protein